jgi:hypothetical protein
VDGCGVEICLLAGASRTVHECGEVMDGDELLIISEERANELRQVEPQATASARVMHAVVEVEAVDVCADLRWSG